MACIVRRFAVLFVGGLMCLVLPASAAKAQTRPPTFDIAVGTQYGVQDRERPVTPGWIVSSGFALGRQVFVVEGAWHRQAYVREHPRDFDEVFREKLQSRNWMLMAGVRSGERPRAGGASTRSWPVASRPGSGGTMSGRRR